MYKHAEEDRDKLKHELDVRASELAAEREGRKAVEDMNRELLESVRLHEEANRNVRSLLERRPSVDWEAQLAEYLEKKKKQGDAPVTLENLRTYLTPFKDWLLKERVQPSAQRIKEYLAEVRKYGRDSYKKVGGEIADFVNHFAERHADVTLIPPCGPVKRQLRPAMPLEVMATLKTHVEARLRGLAPPQEKCQKLRMKAHLAKYLGKYQLSCRTEAARARLHVSHCVTAEAHAGLHISLRGSLRAAAPCTCPLRGSLQAAAACTCL